MVKTCVCAFEACRDEGSEAGFTFPSDPDRQRLWLERLGRNPEEFHVTQNSRVSIVHFKAEDLTASRCDPQRERADQQVTKHRGADPVEHGEKFIRASAVGSLGRSLKAEARAAALLQQLKCAQGDVDRARKLTMIKGRSCGP